MIALLRHVQIPARYVSGYLYRSREDHDRSTPEQPRMVEVLLPHWLGGIRPNQQSRGHHRHIRTAVAAITRCPAHARHLPRQNRQRALRAVQVEPANVRRSGPQLPIPEDWSVLVERASSLRSRPSLH